MINKFHFWGTNDAQKLTNFSHASVVLKIYMFYGTCILVGPSQYVSPTNTKLGRQIKYSEPLTKKPLGAIP